MENLALEVTDAGDLGADRSWHAAFETVERVPGARAIAVLHGLDRARSSSTSRKSSSWP